jgi:ABC-type bacteriocin/lantibiotic exporter with double-glycine peptidase domain
MRMQSHPNLCGFASLANAFKAIGKSSVTEDKLAAAAKKAATATETPEQDGAGVRSLQQAAEAFGHVLVPYTFGDVTMGWGLLRHYLDECKPALLAVDDNSHWVTAFSTLGDKVMVADPAEAELVLPYTKEKLGVRWGTSFYALFLWQASKPRKSRKKVQ